jgi:hypothetical protein
MRDMVIGDFFKLVMIIGLVWLIFASTHTHPTPSCPNPLKPDHHYIEISESKMRAISTPKLKCIPIQGPVTDDHRMVWVCTRRLYHP